MSRRLRPDHIEQAKMLDAPIVELAGVSLAPEIAFVRTQMRDQFGMVKPLTTKWRDEFARQTVVFNIIEGGDLLDVGYAHGIFLSACALSGRFVRLCGIDIADYEPFFNAGFQALKMDVRDDIFVDDGFDTVTAMEIIEHLPGDSLHAGINTIRRLAPRRVITVPFCEGRLHRGHHQRFDAQRVKWLFPDADCTVLARQDRGTPWLLIDETSG